MHFLTRLNTEDKRYWLLFAIAAISFIPTIYFYYVGEEAIFPIVSQEMWGRGVWLKQYLYGSDLQHNPLFNWLIIPFSVLIGWEYVLPITRVLTISATLVTALILWWMTRRLFKDDTFAVFSAVGYLTMADPLLYHGWLSYVDPTYAMFIFAAIATLWVGSQEHRTGMIALSGILLTCAFLAKALTAYIFYGGALFVLLFEKRQRSFLLNWPTLFVLALTFSGPLLWYATIPDGIAQGWRMYSELTDKFEHPGVTAYAYRLVSFPAEILFWLGPLTLLAIYFLLRNRNQPESSVVGRLLFLSATAMVLVNFLPYWLSPRGGMRYLIPLYPLIALVAARVVWQSGEAALLLTRRWIIGALGVKFLVVLVVFPYYQSHYRGQNYDTTAGNILAATQGYPLYTTNSSAPGLSVTAYLNKRRPGTPALQFPPAGWTSGFVVTLTADESVGKVFRQYRLGGDDLYLLCRGAACNNPR